MKCGKKRNQWWLHILSITKSFFAVFQSIKSNDKAQVFKLHSEIINEVAKFYKPILPSSTEKAKVSFQNIGKSVVEAFPVLAVSGEQVSYAYFNKTLSAAIRNMRSRIKRKMSSTSLLSPSSNRSDTDDYDVADYPNVRTLSTELTKQVKTQTKPSTAFMSLPDDTNTNKQFKASTSLVVPSPDI